ncbi:hypothetical protein O3886_07685 [Haemophilus sputorum]|jgi:hypothetical protein|uniref:Lipoprotein n=2 Tax=Haemophilus TaxID=724 RepID=A0A7M1NX79_HAEPA|nr:MULTISPECIES: hypothetical protein [Haemophilus]MBF1254873.1 hypothetical protein [Haemophilus sp.]MCQ1857804.1 hypothetical protein [Haemophilus sputorum]QOR17542.1 hypothetical protein INP94_01230 [Haemophilus parainfluenzae]
MMKKTLAFATSAMILTACSHAQSQGEMLCLDKGKSDAHGCFQNLGESYSYLKKACVQVFDVADIKLDDPANKTQAVYGILSEDKQQVEVFASDLPENTILEVVKGGYVSKDGKVRLMKTKKSWKIRK